MSLIWISGVSALPPIPSSGSDSKFYHLPPPRLPVFICHQYQDELVTDGLGEGKWHNLTSVSDDDLKRTKKLTDEQRKEIQFYRNEAIKIEQYYGFSAAHKSSFEDISKDFSNIHPLNNENDSGLSVSCATDSINDEFYNHKKKKMPLKNLSANWGKEPNSLLAQQEEEYLLTVDPTIAAKIMLNSEIRSILSETCKDTHDESSFSEGADGTTSVSIPSQISEDESSLRTGKSTGLDSSVHNSGKQNTAFRSESLSEALPGNTFSQESHLDKYLHSLVSISSPKLRPQSAPLDHTRERKLKTQSSLSSFDSSEVAELPVSSNNLPSFYDRAVATLHLENYLENLAGTSSKVSSPKHKAVTNELLHENTYNDCTASKFALQTTFTEDVKFHGGFERNKNALNSKQEEEETSVSSENLSDTPPSTIVLKKNDIPTPADSTTPGDSNLSSLASNLAESPKPFNDVTTIDVEDIIIGNKIAMQPVSKTESFYNNHMDKEHFANKAEVSKKEIIEKDEKSVACDKTNDSEQIAFVSNNVSRNDDFVNTPSKGDRLFYSKPRLRASSSVPSNLTNMANFSRKDSEHNINDLFNNLELNQASDPVLYFINILKSKQQQELEVLRKEQKEQLSNFVKQLKKLNYSQLKSLISVSEDFTISKMKSYDSDLSSLPVTNDVSTPRTCTLYCNKIQSAETTNTYFTDSSGISTSISTSSYPVSQRSDISQSLESSGNISQEVPVTSFFLHPQNQLLPNNNVDKVLSFKGSSSNVQELLYAQRTLLPENGSLAYLCNYPPVSVTSMLDHNPCLLKEHFTIQENHNKNKCKEYGLDLVPAKEEENISKFVMLPLNLIGNQNFLQGIIQLQALIKGYLVRRLFATSYVQNFLSILSEVSKLADQFHQDILTDNIRKGDIDFHKALFQEEEQARYKIWETFIVMSSGSRMSIIRRDRELEKQKFQRKSKSSIVRSKFSQKERVSSSRTLSNNSSPKSSTRSSMSSKFVCGTNISSLKTQTMISPRSPSIVKSKSPHFDKLQHKAVSALGSQFTTPSKNIRLNSARANIISQSRSQEFVPKVSRALSFVKTSIQSTSSAVVRQKPLYHSQNEAFMKASKKSVIGTHSSVPKKPSLSGSRSSFHLSRKDLGKRPPWH